MARVVVISQAGRNTSSDRVGETEIGELRNALECTRAQIAELLDELRAVHSLQLGLLRQKTNLMASTISTRTGDHSFSRQ